MASSLWLPHSVAGETFDLLNLTHSEVERRVIEEMENGVKVYYDRRWGLTDFFAAWLLQNRDWMEDKRILVLGAGVGLETLVLGRYAQHLYINDLAPISIDLCGEQLQRNGIEHFTPLPGYYESIPLPEVDLVVGCFLVYNRQTLAAMNAFVDRYRTGPLMLINEPLAEFRRFRSECTRPVLPLFTEGESQGIIIPPPPMN